MTMASMTDEIFIMNADQRRTTFEALYKHKFGRPANLNAKNTTVSTANERTGKSQQSKVGTPKARADFINEQIAHGDIKITAVPIFLPSVSKVTTMDGSKVEDYAKNIEKFFGITGKKGPNDNWAYIKTGNVDGQVCIGTYKAHDVLYWIRYWKEFRGSNCNEYVMSAGQPQDGSFQLCVWDKDNNVIHHLDKVYFRDHIHIGKKAGKNCVAHAKGEHWGSEAGLVEIFVQAKKS